MKGIQVLIGIFFSSIVSKNYVLHRTRSQERIETARKVANCFEKNSTPSTVCK